MQPAFNHRNHQASKVCSVMEVHDTVKDLTYFHFVIRLFSLVMLYAFTFNDCDYYTDWSCEISTVCCSLNMSWLTTRLLVKCCYSYKYRYHKLTSDRTYILKSWVCIFLACIATALTCLQLWCIWIFIMVKYFVRECLK